VAITRGAAGNSEATRRGHAARDRPAPSEGRAEIRARFADYYDVWLPELSPSESLVRQALEAPDDRAWAAFVRRYRAEMRRPEASRLLDLLAALSARRALGRLLLRGRGPLPPRSVLRELLREHGADIA